MQHNNPIDEAARLCEILKQELIAIVSSVANSTSSNENTSPPTWMTATQLAEYWRFIDKKGKPRIAGILKWTKRASDEFPLPHAYMGDLLRFHREDVDKWAKEEAERRRVHNERKRLRIA